MSSDRPIEPTLSSISPKNAAADKGPKTSAKSALGSKVEPSPKDEKDSSHRKPNDTPIWKIVLECAAVVIGIIVAIIYYEQWKAMDTSMKIDQRAWMSLAQITNSGKFAIGEPFAVNVSYKNIGKTPARNVYATATIEPREQGQDPRFERDLENAVPVGLMIPNADFYGSATLTTCHLEGNGVRGPTFTCPLTEDEYKAVENGNQTVYIHGRVAYDDVFGHHHWFKFCYILLAHSGQWALCNQGRAVGQQADDDNE
jgi:hypothetical protein